MVTKKRKRKYWLILLIVIVIVGLGLFGYSRYKLRETQKLWTLPFEQMIEVNVENNPEAIVTVGYIQEGEASWEVYGQPTGTSPNKLYDYEIGSITKTMTAALIAKAVEEEKLSLADTIDDYLPLNENNEGTYPTIEGLLTHTAGYKSYYFEWDSMIRNYIQGHNMLGNVSREQLLQKISEIDLDNEDMGSFYYSNVGPAILGLILEEVYQEDYDTLMEGYLKEELALQKTWLSLGDEGNLTNYWHWEEGAAYMPAGAMVSNIEDMLTYLDFNMTEERSELTLTHEKLFDVVNSDLQMDSFGVYIDGVGMAWMLDEHTNIIWHNGATIHFNCYLGFDKENQVGVVVLSNLPVAQMMQVPATIMGPKLLNELREDRGN